MSSMLPRGMCDVLKNGAAAKGGCVGISTGRMNVNRGVADVSEWRGLGVWGASAGMSI